MLSDYRILQRIGRAESTGEHYVNRLGHSKQKTVYREYLITSIGQLTKDEWFQKAYAEMVKENKMDLYNRIVDHCWNNCACLHNDKDIKFHALECLVNEAYKAWNMEVNDEES